MVRAQGLDGLRQLRLAVLDDMTFVEDAVEPLVIGKLGDIVPDDVVGCDDHIMGGEMSPELRAHGWVADVEQRAQGGDVSEDLMAPMTG
jgi:hypothetical protein